MATPPLQAGQDCGAKEATPVAREASPLPSLSGGGWSAGKGWGSRAPEARALGHSPRAVRASCLGAAPPASPSGPPCCLALCRQLSPGGHRGSFGRRGQATHWPAAEPIQVCLKLPGGQLWEKRPGHPLAGPLNPFRFV